MECFGADLPTTDPITAPAITLGDAMEDGASAAEAALGGGAVTMSPVGIAPAEHASCVVKT
jgi:hypothetical protein